MTICVYLGTNLQVEPMIHVLLCTLAERMNEFLSSYYDRAERMVEVGVVETTRYHKSYCI